MNSRRPPWNRLASAALLLAVCLAHCTTVTAQDESEIEEWSGDYVPAQRPTLLSWASADPFAEPEPPYETISTDRPDFTEASNTVGQGRIQLETGYTFLLDDEAGVRTETHSYPETLLRIGMFAEWFEVRLGWNYASQRDFDAGGSLGVDGGEDLYLGVKLWLTEQEGWLPEMALMPQMTVPTGADAFTSDEVLPGLNWLYGWDVNDFLSAGGSTQANRAVDDSGESYLEVAQSFTLGYGLGERLGAYTEWFALFPHSAIDPGARPEHYFNGGFTFLLADNVQFDVRAGLGLNAAADDFFAGPGLSFRY